jgi:hypothetical protein
MRGIFFMEGKIMRCPKCGYISFDHLETCKKCHKPIGALTSEINGTIYEAMAPAFLTFTAEPPAAQPPPLGLVEEIDFEAIEEPKIRAGIDTEFILRTEPDLADREEAELSIAENELIVNLDEFSEVSPRAEYTLNLDAEEDDTELPLPTLDFGDLDITDLAPPPKEPAVAHAPEEELVLATESIAAAAPASPQPGKQAAVKSTGLEDLNFNGLDLESPAKIVSGSAAGKRYLPSVKTGTALDKFDIDLGDLFSEKKK